MRPLNSQNQGLQNAQASAVATIVEQIQHRTLQIMQSVPVILLSSATAITATGAISGLTALPYTPSGVVQVYCFAQAGLAAGLYYARFSSATACQLYTDAAGTITPTGITPAAYAGGTTQATLASFTIPGGTLGPSGLLACEELWSVPNNANSKTVGHTFGGISRAGSTSASATWRRSSRMQNRNNQAQQVYETGSPAFGDTNTTAAVVIGAVDTALPQTLAIVATLAVATDFAICEAFRAEVVCNS